MAQVELGGAIKKLYNPWVNAGKPLDPDSRFWEWRWKRNPNAPRSCLKAWGHPNKPEEHIKGKQHRTKRTAVWLRGKTAMDVGSGLGHLFCYLKEDVDDYLGIDCKPMTSLARQCWLGHKEKFQVGDIFDLSGLKWGEHKCGSYDTVFSLQVLQHIPVLLEPLQEMWDHASLCVVIAILPLGPSRLFIHRTGTIDHRYNREELETIINRLEPKPVKVEIHDTQKREFPKVLGSPINQCIVRINKK